MVLLVTKCTAALALPSDNSRRVAISARMCCKSCLSHNLSSFVLIFTWSALGNNALRARGRSRGRRAETPEITYEHRARTRLRRVFSSGRAGNRGPFPAAGRQAAVLGARRPIRVPTTQPAKGITKSPHIPHTTTQCTLSGHQGARGAARGREKKSVTPVVGGWVRAQKGPG
jgi:hypothetical protein